MYDAIMKAADWIGKHPELWNFQSLDIPNNCGTPGCALGWIGYWSGEQRDLFSVAEALAVATPGIFYDRMSDINQGLSDWLYIPVWNDSTPKAAPIAARCLRVYAETYHGHEKKAGIPDSVRAIFEEPETLTEERA